MKNLNLLAITFLAVVTMVGYSAKSTYAADNVCFCHNLANNPITICTDNQGLINGHNGHVENGTDSLGECPVPPQVPEFGLITGALALAGSAGSYFLLKKRV